MGAMVEDITVVNIAVDMQSVLRIAFTSGIMDEWTSANDCFQRFLRNRCGRHRYVHPYIFHHTLFPCLPHEYPALPDTMVPHFSHLPEDTLSDVINTTNTNVMQATLSALPLTRLAKAYPAPQTWSAIQSLALEKALAVLLMELEIPPKLRATRWPIQPRPDPRHWA
jgi:hypothetical protein